MDRQRLLLMGNEAIGLGLVEAGVGFISAYPGTPSSEVLPAAARFAKELNPSLQAQWAVNEKVAVELALAAAYTGLGAAAAMKQVGLNVAMDPVMSSAYIGVKGAMVLVVADDPGPHSSQTEQDSRLAACFAKLPALDPMSPAHARTLARIAVEMSRRFGLPVLLRPVLRVCHGRQDMDPPRTPPPPPRPVFERDPMRWAAIPRQRLELHRRLNKLLVQVREWAEGRQELARWAWQPPDQARLGIVASGQMAAMARDVLEAMGLAGSGELAMVELGMSFPLPLELIRELAAISARVLVLEQTEAVVELLLPRELGPVMGRASGHVPGAGEITPEVLEELLAKAMAEAGIVSFRRSPRPVELPPPPPRRPTLCPGCPHRPVFWAMRRFFPGGIYPGDIGCYTLGLNQGAVDICHDMGGAINFATGLSRVLHTPGRPADVPIIATIGDSTFFHSGAAGLVEAVAGGGRFVLVILDNMTTAMTGMQPTPASGWGTGRPVSLEELVAGCGAGEARVVDAYDIKAVAAALRQAWRAARTREGGVQVVIARRACMAHDPRAAVSEPVEVEVLPGPDPAPARFEPGDKGCSDCGRCIEICPAGAIRRVEKGLMEVDPGRCSGCRLCAEVCPTGAMRLEAAGGCVGCGVCLEWFGCPGLVRDREGKVRVDPQWCVGCGVCTEVCAHGAIRART